MITRIRQLLNWQQLSPTQFADLIGVGRPVVSHILSERNKPSLEVVQRIIAAFPAVSLPWLLSGSGPMLVAANEPAATPVATSAVVLPAVSAPTLPLPKASIASVAAPSAAQKPQPLSPSPGLRHAAGPAPARFVATKPRAAALLPRPAGESPEAAATPAPASVPPTPMVAAPPNEAPAQVASSLPAPGLAPVLIAPPAVATPVAEAPQLPSPETAALLPFLGEPGKAIRRIVIFYRDGSFADYQPES